MAALKGVSMEIPAELWYQAIFVRRSRRSFIDRLPEAEKLDRLEKVCREFRPFAGVRAEFLRNSPEKVFKGIVGGYGKITGAPYYVAFIGTPGSPNVEEGIGYTGEGVILEATALGLGTCWVSGFFRPEAVKEHIALAENERIYAVTPVGYTEKGFSVKEKFYEGAARSLKKKPLRQLSRGRRLSPGRKRPSRPPASLHQRQTGSPGYSLSEKKPSLSAWRAQKTALDIPNVLIVGSPCSI